MNKLYLSVIVIIVALLVVKSFVFTVDQTEHAIVIQLGKPVGGVRGPGLHFKLPVIQDVVTFERRLLVYDADPREILTSDKKNLVVDNYSTWRIVQPLLFYQSLKTVRGGQSRLDDIIYSEVRALLGQYSLTEIISEKRHEIMADITKNSDLKARQYGIEVVDVRIKRADLPPENEQAVFGRMKAERERAAKQYRSEGQEVALRIRAEADRQRTVILANAYKTAQEARGEGDGESTRIYAEAFETDPEFFDFWRSLEAYQTALKGNSTYVLQADSELLKYFR